MRMLVLDGDTVVNVIKADPANLPAGLNAVQAPDGVGIGWVWNDTDYDPPAPEPVDVQQVKDEAQRRILRIAPEWKQRNLTAQAVLLAQKGSANWTAEDRAAWDAGEAIWIRIAAIRATSDQIEAMEPIPQDFTDDTHWPE